ncbi:hypothetical protein NUW58_g4874 [Xylaria curta]|uniref:Uncharacterized protein n=1 Tax=Xylaria curta TaxID=42375 RepID=A0ACC1P636_9PEZI|nr:hypothetical protein NUW58_g4874 [Xylaria curta]
MGRGGYETTPAGGGPGPSGGTSGGTGQGGKLLMIQTHTRQSAGYPFTSLSSQLTLLNSDYAGVTKQRPSRPFGGADDTTDESTTQGHGHASLSIASNT